MSRKTQQTSVRHPMDQQLEIVHHFKSTLHCGVFCFWPRCAAFGILVPQPGIKPATKIPQAAQFNNTATKQQQKTPPKNNKGGPWNTESSQTEPPNNLQVA